jgi:hypothetical protein
MRLRLSSAKDSTGLVDDLRRVDDAVLPSFGGSLSLGVAGARLRARLGPFVLEAVMGRTLIVVGSILDRAQDSG